MGVNQPPGLLRSRNLSDILSAGSARGSLGMGALSWVGPGATPMVVGNMGTVLIPANPGTSGDTTNNSLNTQKICYAPLLSGLTDIQIGMPGWSTTVGGGVETDLPTAYTVAGSIEYPVGSTPRRVYWGGAASFTVNPGRNFPRSDPLPIYIPPGAMFYAKIFVTWTAGSFWYSSYSPYTGNAEWTNIGVGLSDHTMDNTVLTQTTPGSGFFPLVFGRTQSAIPVVGVLGDSIGNGGTDLVDPLILSNGWQRALRNHLPVMNQSTGGYSMIQYLLRQEGLNLPFRYPNGSPALTDLLMEMGTNDIFAGATLAQMQANLLATINPFLARGIRVSVCTLLPRTTSSDGWLTLANQGWSSSAFEAVRMGYNAYLRANWKALGIFRLVDMCLAIDPNNVGKWGCDPGITNVPTLQSACFATVSGGVVTSMYRGTGYGGAGYPASSTLPLTTYPYPGQTGSGATGLLTTNSSGQAISAALTSPGSANYSDVPMVNILGPWTLDGTHPTSRGTNEIIYQSNFGPETFLQAA